MNKKFRKAIARSVAGVLAALSNVGSASAVFDVSKTIAIPKEKEGYVMGDLMVPELLDSEKIAGDTLGDKLLSLQNKLEQNLGKGKAFLGIDCDDNLPLPKLTYFLCSKGAPIRRDDLAHKSTFGFFGFGLGKTAVPVYFSSQDLAEFVVYCMEHDNSLISLFLRKDIQKVISRAKNAAEKVEDWNSISKSVDYWPQFLWYLRDKHTDVFKNIFRQYYEEPGEMELKVKPEKKVAKLKKENTKEMKIEGMEFKKENLKKLETEGTGLKLEKENLKKIKSTEENPVDVPVKGFRLSRNGQVLTGAGLIGVLIALGYGYDQIFGGIKTDVLLESEDEEFLANVGE